MLARSSQERNPVGATGSRRDRAPTPAAAVLGLQRGAGNAAGAGRLGRRRLARDHKRAEIKPPGQGYDGILEVYGQGNAPRTNLTTAQKQAVTAYRTWMEGTFNPASGYDKSTWAREAGSRAAVFEGGAAARAQVYGEMQRQIIQATGGGASSWQAFLERGADGSYIFRGNTMPPGGGLQRVFVVNPQGDCFVGDVTALEGRGAGKTVRYDLLRRIGTPAPSGGGAAGGGAVKPPAVEPARTPKVEPKAGGPKVEPKVGGPKVEPKGGQAPKVEGPAPKVTTGGPATPKVTMPGWLKGGTMLGVQVLLFWWLGQKAEKAQKRRMAELMDTKINPAVAAALQGKAAEAELLTARAPEFTVYANVTMELDERWTESGIGGAQSDHTIADARFVDLQISTKKLQSETRIRHDKFSGFSQITNHESTKRITYSFEVDFGETKEQHRWRMFRKQAGEAAQRGLKARDVAGRQHFDPELTPADRREEDRRRKWGLRPLREELQTAEQILWVHAYIDYTFWADLDKLWADAVKYLHELEEYDRREAKRYGTPTRTEVEQERRLRDYVSKS